MLGSPHSRSHAFLIRRLALQSRMSVAIQPGLTGPHSPELVPGKLSGEHGLLTLLHPLLAERLDCGHVQDNEPDVCEQQRDRKDDEQRRSALTVSTPMSTVVEENVGRTRQR